jgi:AmiR/NasT family two-component response regulator
VSERTTGSRELSAVDGMAEPADATDGAGPRTELEAALAQVEQLQRKVENLTVALESNREIGVAVGILMATHLLTAEQAFNRLRDVSQRRHRKLRDIAQHVVSTGELPSE